MTNSIFRDHLLKDKIAFITGGGSGINLRMAEQFAGHGAKLMLVGRTQEKLDRAVGHIQAGGGNAISYAADVRDYAAMEAALAKTREHFGEIDIVVCGAAGNFPAPAMGMSANGFKSVIDIDVLGTFNTCRAAFEHLRKPGASIIAISATHAFMPVLMQSHVCAAKAGIDMLVKVLAMEWGPAGVRINCISPGPVDDTEGMKRLTPTDEMKQNLINTIPLRRYATKDELAELAIFLCSESATYITGAVFVCDGGQSLMGSGAFAQAMGL
jgi:NAD(P)-dependent dehydrogenase (short-subunit alcohol dehydrogenase family)